MYELPHDPTWALCDSCGGPARFWETTDVAWKAIAELTGKSILCLVCATRAVEISLNNAVYWIVHPTTLKFVGVDERGFGRHRSVTWPDESVYVRQLGRT